MSEESNPFADWGSAGDRVGRGDADEPTEAQVPDGARPRGPRRASVRVVLVVLLAVAGVVVAAARWSAVGSSTAPSAPPATLVSMPLAVDRPFTTVGPRGWLFAAAFVTTGVIDYQLTNTRSEVPSTDVIPPRGTIEIQITNVPPADVAAYLGPRAVSQAPLELLRHFRRPAGATDVTPLVRAHATSIKGVAAARDSYEFTYEGRRDVQTRLALRKGATVVGIQVDAAPLIAPRAISALNVVLAHWLWYGPAHPAPPPPTPPMPAAVPAAPSPTGQWIASGFVDYVGGDVANAYLDEPEIRAWEFTRVCAARTSCHTEMVRQLQDGETLRAPLEQIRGSKWWRATFPKIGDLCGREPGRSTPKETISDTVSLGWVSLSNRRQLVADETQTINGCGGPTPGTINDHWTATPVPPAAVPTISPNRAHSASAAAFRRSALRVCTRINDQATPAAVRIGTAKRILQSTTNLAAKAAADATIASQLTVVARVWAELYRAIPQPPSGALDTIWLEDVAAGRQQVGQAAAALAALQSTARAMSRYFATGRPIQLQTAIAEGTLFNEDIAKTGTAGPGSNALGYVLGLPPVCTSPPAITAIFTSPKVS